MQREFWLERWSNDQIGFHQLEVDAWLQKYWPELELSEDSSVFVPLCGKSLDMSWLADRGHPVIGVELAEDAVRAFYEESGRPYRVEPLRHLQRFTDDRINIFCGDFMDLTALHLHAVAAVYDRAALIALPAKMRAHYADHLQRIIPPGCRILLLTLEYQQSRVSGPPHSVEEAELQTLFGARCNIERLGSAPARSLPPRFTEAGIGDVREVVYLLTKES